MIATANGNDIITLHVRLLNELVEVWRPVDALEIRAGHFYIVPQQVPEGEEWEFLPGTTVLADIITKEFGHRILRARCV